MYVVLVQHRVQVPKNTKCSPGTGNLFGAELMSNTPIAEAVFTKSTEKAHLIPQLRTAR